MMLSTISLTTQENTYIVFTVYRHYSKNLLAYLIIAILSYNLIAIKLNLNLRLVSLVSSNKETDSQRNQVTY